MSKLFKEWLYACRKLRKNPVSTVSSILVLAIAIGANAAIYTLTDNLSVTEPAGANAAKVVLVGAEPRDPQFQDFFEFDGTLADTIEEGLGSFERLSRVSHYWLTISRIEKPLRIQGLRVSDGFLQAVGVSALAGRTLEAADFEIGGLPGLMVTRQTWLDGWAGAPEAIGSLVDVNGVQHRLVGVLPESFSFERRTFGAVVASSYKEERFAGVYMPFVYMAGHLKAGVTEAQARAELKGLEPRLKDLTNIPGYWERATLDVKKLNAQEDGFVEDQIAILLSIGLVILLVAAFNVANLTLVRLNSRGAEYATRVALGARRGDLLRLSALENGTLVGVGYGIGIAFGYGIIQIVVTRFEGAEWGLLEQLSGELSLNLRVLAATGLACLLALGVISLTTLAFTSSSRISSFMKQDSRSATGSRVFNRISGALLFLKIAFTCGLLVIGGFFFVSLNNINNYDYGYELSDTWRGNVNLPFYRFEGGEGAKELVPMLDAILHELRSVPGVEAATYSKLQFPHWGFRWWVKLKDTPPDIAGADLPQSWKGVVYPGYFDLVGMRLLEGETFGELHNVYEGEKVTIVNEAFVKEHFKGANPLGEYVETNLMGQVGSYRVIGVVNNVHRWWRDDEAEPTMYFANAADHAARFWSWIYVKAPRWSGEVERAAQAAILRVEPEAVVAGFVGLGEDLDRSQSSFRFIVFIQTLVSSIGFVLSCVGIYTAVAYAVAQRRRELGIRLALGAQPRSIRNRVLLRSLGLLLPAVALGVAAAFVFLVPLDSFEDQLYLVEPSNVYVYAFAGLTLVAVGIGASLAPALRAARIDPNRALHEL